MKDNNLEEIWKDVPDYEGYQASNLGRIISLERIVNNNGGTRLVKERILKPNTKANGYQTVCLFKNGKRNWLLIHRLVYASFNGKIPDGIQVNHINEDKSDNRLENLNLMTSKENCNFGTRNERCAKALSKPVVGYDNEGNVVVTFPSANEAGRNGYIHGHIAACCRGERKTHRGLRWKYKDGDC